MYKLNTLNMNRTYSLIAFVCLAFIPLFITQKVNCQVAVDRDSVKLAALEIMNETHYCGLVTIDSEGQPQMRTMNPFPANDELITWFATSRTSRKVSEIKNNPKVCVYYADHLNAKGYVSIVGTAQIIDDKDLLVKMKRDYWNGIPDWQNKFVLIKIIPKKMDVINYKHGINNDPDTFRAPSIVF
jgi:general stress protein 26